MSISIFVIFVIYRTPARGVFAVVSNDSVFVGGVRYVGSVVSVPSVPDGVASVLCEVGWGVRWEGGRRFRWGRWGRPVCRVVRQSGGSFGSEWGSPLGRQSPKISPHVLIS